MKKIYLMVCVLIGSLSISGYISGEISNFGSVLKTNSSSTSTPSPAAQASSTTSASGNIEATMTAAAQGELDSRKYNARGDRYFAKEKFIEAISDYIHGLMTDPKNQGDLTLIKSAESQLNKGSSCDAMTALDILSGLPTAKKVVDKSLYKVIYQCGQEQKNSGDLDEARKIFQRIVKDSPSSTLRGMADRAILEVDWIQSIENDGIETTARDICNQSLEKKGNISPKKSIENIFYISGTDWNKYLPPERIGTGAETTVIVCVGMFENSILGKCPYTRIGGSFVQYWIHRVRLYQTIRFIDPITRRDIIPAYKLLGGVPEACKNYEQFSAYQSVKTSSGNPPNPEDLIKVIENKFNIPKKSPTKTPEPTTTQPITNTPTLTPTRRATWTAIPKPIPQAETTRISAKDGMVSIYIPEGEFLMGSTQEHTTLAYASCSDCEAKHLAVEMPQHRVYLDGYWIDQTEVTNAMYAKFVDDTKYITQAEENGWGWVYNASTNTWEDKQGVNWQHPFDANKGIEAMGNYPVVAVTWKDADAYCKWAGGRLPTEAQWEKAARGPNGYIFPWGDDQASGKLMNYCDKNCPASWKDESVDDGFASLAPVGSFPDGASPYGVLDMAGNVDEWINEWFDDEKSLYEETFQKNPQGAVNGSSPILRGGCWGDGSISARTTDRSWVEPDVQDSSIGFRCVRSE